MSSRALRVCVRSRPVAITRTSSRSIASSRHVRWGCPLPKIVGILLPFAPVSGITELAPLISSALPANDAREEPWRLLDVEQAAARFGRSTRWVRNRVKAGELPSVRLDGGALAFELADDLQAFARARRVALEEPQALAARLQAAHQATRKPRSASALGSGHEAPYPVPDRRVSR